MVVKNSTDLQFPSGLEAGVRSRKTVDDKGQNRTQTQCQRAERTKGLRSTCEREKSVLNPMSADKVEPVRGDIQSIATIIVAQGSENHNEIMLVLMPLSLDRIQAPATDDVEHANAERSVERLLLEQKG